MSTDKPETAVAVPAPQPAAMVDGHSDMAAAMVYGEAVGQYYCSMPKTDPAVDDVLFKCSFAPDARVSELINGEVVIRHIFGKQATFTDEESGEETSGTITCLITPDNRVISCASNGVRASIAQIMQRFGSVATWTQDVKVKVRQIDRNKRRMFVLQVIGQVSREKRK